ncbi:izumo sperm-egg fusion protein 4 [Microcaecilia unicolor]|uniref:Izumo sperm-egg fusion protein 4 n=1 Tax=Microcaecilia unicolor TaxID=1415580 RepID=A0A6P7ZDI4_9AMPH|nr:izumo sperm-egg fusion protein 4 [Microcaecilia unicolor]
MGTTRLSLPLLLLLAALAHGCLHCDSAFQQKFTFYRQNMSWKSWWVGDRTAALHILQKWKPRTLEGLQLNIAQEIPQDKLHSVAMKVYEKLDSVYKEFMYKPGIFPQILSSVLKAQTLMLRDEIVQSRLDCEKQCGIYEYDTISCISCNASVATCFGYNCGTSEEWEAALESLPKYIKLMTMGISQKPNRLTNLSGKFLERQNFLGQRKKCFSKWHK